MSPRDILAAISVAIVWGLSFIAIKVGVGETSPLMLSALQIAVRSVPGFLPRAAQGAGMGGRALRALIGVGQFGLLFMAIHQGFPVGLASLVIQLQVFFTILLAWAFLGERPRRMQSVGAAVAFAGMAVIGSERLAGASLWPFLMVILAAAFWAPATSWPRATERSTARLHRLVEPGRAIASRRAVARRRRAGGVASLAHPSLKLIVACWRFPMPGLCSATACGRA